MCKSTQPLWPDRTVARYRNGISHQEAERLRNTVYYMKRRKMPLWWVVLGDQLLELESGQAREEVDRFTSMLVRYQERAGLPQYWCRVFEVTEGLHANVIFPGNAGMATAGNCFTQMSTAPRRTTWQPSIRKGQGAVRAMAGRSEKEQRPAAQRLWRGRDHALEYKVRRRRMAAIPITPTRAKFRRPRPPERSGRRSRSSPRSNSRKYPGRDRLAGFTLRRIHDVRKERSAVFHLQLPRHRTGAEAELPHSHLRKTRCRRRLRQELD